LIHLFSFHDLRLGWTLFKIRGPRLAVVDVEFEFGSDSCILSGGIDDFDKTTQKSRAVDL
jgi:hypothetical protein